MNKEMADRKQFFQICLYCLKMNMVYDFGNPYEFLSFHDQDPTRITVDFFRGDLQAKCMCGSFLIDGVYLPSTFKLPSQTVVKLRDELMTDPQWFIETLIAAPVAMGKYGSYKDHLRIVELVDMLKVGGKVKPKFNHTTIGIIGSLFSLTKFTDERIKARFVFLREVIARGIVNENG